MSSQLLNRTTAPQAVRFFWACFRQGVFDACEYGNDLDAKEFCERHGRDWSFGVLGVQEDCDWQMFRNQLYWWARRAGLKSLAEGYIFRIRSKNYLWALLPYCMRFYLMGIGEWLKYPNPGGIQIFRSRPMTHWDPSSPVAKVTRVDIVSYLHGFEFDFRQTPEDGREVSEAAMSAFVKALFDLSSKYVTGREEEDV